MDITPKDVLQAIGMLFMLGGVVVTITRQIGDLKTATTLLATETRGELARMADSLDVVKESMQGQAGKMTVLEAEVRDLREWRARAEQVLVGLRDQGRL
jgi:hypothetical protein